MIAWAGLERLRLGVTDGLDTPARARWPLDSVTAHAEPAAVVPDDAAADAEPAPDAAKNVAQEAGA